jgi:phosphomannomutase
MTVGSKKLIIFDLDGTLSKSKFPVDEEMAELITRLLKNKKVAIISGGGYPQFQKQFLAMLPRTTDNYSNLFLMPTSGTRLYTWENNWVEKYAENLTTNEKEKIMLALNNALRKVNYTPPKKVFGEIIEDRGSQITFSALGQKAPNELKNAWDPTREKRQRITDNIQRKLIGFDVRIGGSTSIDITKRGVNKGYGVRKLKQFLNMPDEEIVFVGDALFYGGNDYPVKAMGIDCLEVKNPEDTKQLVRSWID